MHRPPLPPAARGYVALVIAAGCVLLVTALPIQLERPAIFGSLLALSSLASLFKISLPLWRGWATMSASDAFQLTSLLLLGPAATMPIAAVGAWIQSAAHARTPQPTYRNLFNAAALVITVWAAGSTFEAFGGTPGQLEGLATPLLAATTAYFLANSVLSAIAVGLSTRQGIYRCWNDNFLWSAPGYFLSAGVAAVAARIIAGTNAWLVLFLVLPVVLGYRAYRVYFGRVEAEQKRLLVTLRSIGDGVVTTDIAGAVDLVNDVAERLTGWSHEDAVSRPLSDVLRIVDRASGEPVPNVVRRVLKGERVGGHEESLALVSRDGGRYPIDLVGAPIVDRDGTSLGTVVVVRDVSEALRMEEERLKTSKLESLGVLAGGIAHDFNNVLTAIVGHLTLMHTEGSVTPAVREQLEEAERACLRARALTHRLLTFSRGGAPVRRPMYVDRLVAESARFALHGSNVRLILDLDPDLWPVDADEGQLDRALSNIVINAMQSMPSGGEVRIEGRNLTEAAPPQLQRGHYACITIADTGPGVPASDVGRIFDPYFTTKPRGTGLGLATTLSVVRAHGGTVTVDSPPRGGAVFRVYLPRTTEPVPARKVDAVEGHGVGRILVMDDDPMVRKVTTAMLARLGYQAEAVEDGAQAVARYDEALAAGRPFRAVLLDLTVPGGMGGERAIASLRHSHPAVRAVVFSGYTDQAVLADYTRYGFDARLTKPFTLRDLGETLRDLLGERLRS